MAITILQGVEFSIFPIDYEWALQQCSATALPVKGSVLHQVKEKIMTRLANLIGEQNGRIYNGVLVC